ncbi:MAG: tRNA (cytidine(34)-2'-O)-methyltransferase [Xanthomonadales bacterium]|nr:tRNA (cytidine(34)-2'-O)-methyltransferase [Xanthomonadales bacterium]MCC6593663.1 tRNA (cytidine(34)-2'-O)-methyltransferase [Xanthomonadales bacterium]MCE7931537.1 tRNA (cytidine(34)-2'-O)-methyltransferase [Xanthomonadales bacterium PRO6]
MLDIVLHQPQIPPNTGNVIRLAANTGAGLHLIEPLGFALDDQRLRRAGLDYREYARLRVWPDLDACLAALGQPRCFALTTHASRSAYATRFAPGDALLFGCESRGLPAPLHERFPPERRLRLPMRPQSRSLNLSNAVAVVVYEAWRQLGFEGATG